ncbi:hypothetical protein Tcan_16714 [Toxocara canis]|uniref:Uncharacterized protein n=1 Tax=Toxocara canis TaxID=6265 RepID=A0A0B2VCZ8_TOXCA|nr:hypothetical protein Tcan_16714 [Toxocara canis]
MSSFLVASCSFVKRDSLRTYTLFLCFTALPWDCFVTLRNILRIVHNNGCTSKAPLPPPVLIKVHPSQTPPLLCSLNFVDNWCTKSHSGPRVRHAKSWFVHPMVIPCTLQPLGTLGAHGNALHAVIAITKFNPGGSQFYQRRRFLTVFVLYSIPILILNLPKLSKHAVIAITKFNPGGSQFYQRRRFLTVFVLYSIPILILNLPKLISIIFMYVIQPLSPGSRKLIPILRAMNEAVITIEQYRSITTSTCTVLLLNAYRVAAIKVIKGALHWRDNRVTSMSPAFVVRFAHAATK